MSTQTAESPLATKLRVARVATGLTMKEFAKKHGLNADRLCRIERGQMYVPPAWRPILSEVLDIRQDELIDDRGIPRLFE